MNRVVLRRVQLTLLVVGLVVTVLAVSLVVGCFRDDAKIDAAKGTVMADVVQADAVHAAAYFQTPDGQIHSPKLGLLYPTELAKGQQISVEYDRLNPDLARPAGRSASLAIMPAISVVLLGWLVVAAVMLALAQANRIVTRRAACRSGPDDGSVDPGAPLTTASR